MQRGNQVDDTHVPLSLSNKSGASQSAPTVCSQTRKGALPCKVSFKSCRRKFNSWKKLSSADPESNGSFYHWAYHECQLRSECLHTRISFGWIWIVS